MVNSALAGNFKKASLEAFELIDPIDLSFAEGSPGGVKYIMKCLGICDVHVRLPLTPPSSELQAKIEAYVSGLS